MNTVDPPERSVPPAPVPGCRLCVALVGDAELAWSEPLVEALVEPSLVGTPVLASDGSLLVVLGGALDGRVHIWTGRPGALVDVGELDPTFDPVALVAHEGTWHLFATDASRNNRHLVGTDPTHLSDLAGWREDGRFAQQHPNLVVRGVASTASGLMLLGEVVVQSRSVGWTMLDLTDEVVRARRMAFPMSPDHRVIGPAASGDGTALALVSSMSTMLARTVDGTSAQSWTLALPSSDVVPALIVGDGTRLWLAGADRVGGSPMIAEVGGRSFHLDRSGGPVCAAVLMHDELVLARTPVAGSTLWSVADEAGAAEEAGVPARLAPDDQSSPAYIDSISAA